MKRRKALKYTASILGMSILGAEMFLSGCSQDKKNEEFLSNDDILLLDEIGETILPESDRSPGAKAAEIGLFMKNTVQEFYTEEEQKIFLSGLKIIENAANKRFSKGFLEINPNQRLEILTEFDKESKNKELKKIHFFTMIKQMTLWGYFSSEPGVTRALRYEPSPGFYDPCVEYKDGDKAIYGYLSSIG